MNKIQVMLRKEYPSEEDIDNYHIIKSYIGVFMLAILFQIELLHLK